MSEYKSIPLLTPQMISHTVQDLKIITFLLIKSLSALGYNFIQKEKITIGAIVRIGTYRLNKSFDNKLN